MNQNNQRPTPETDAELARLEEFDFAGVKMEGNFVSSLLARRLERKRDETRETLRNAEAELSVAVERHEKQLEAMHSAIQETHSILQSISKEYDPRFFRAGKWSEAAITKLQPYLKPWTKPLSSKLTTC